jgi:hypothetical protein
MYLMCLCTTLELKILETKIPDLKAQRFRESIREIRILMKVEKINEIENKEK